MFNINLDILIKNYNHLLREMVNKIIVSAITVIKWSSQQEHLEYS